MHRPKVAHSAGMLTLVDSLRLVLVSKTEDAQQRTEHARAEATEKLNGLVAVVDDFIRRQPKQ
jgi:hypothetical protein